MRRLLMYMPARHRSAKRVIPLGLPSLPPLPRWVSPLFSGYVMARGCTAFGGRGFLFFVALFFAATAPLASYVQKTFFAPAPLPAPTMVFTLGPQQGPAAQNIVNNTYYPVVERIIGTSSAMGISEEYFAAQLTRIYDTISRHRGSGSTVDFSDLTAADIPALDYLPLAGGTLTGALTLLSLDTSATSTLAGITLESTDCSVFGNGGKLTTDSSGNVVCDDDSAGSGSGTPGGSNTQVQFNDGSSFGGNAGFTFNKTAGRLAVAYASTTGITADYASSTSLFAGTLTLNTALSVANGGTGSTTLGGLLSGNGTSIYSSATTTASCAGSVSCSAFTILGQSPVSISATDNTASTTLLSDSNTFSGTNTFSNTITGSITGNAGTVTNGVYTTTFNGLFDARFITDLAATTSIASITTLQNLSILSSQVSDLATTIGAAYPFQLTGNATSTLTQFNGGLTAYASSTIGSGTQIGGLTISGGATTTGTAYFGGKVGIGTTAATGTLHVQKNASTFTPALYLQNDGAGNVGRGTGLLFSARTTFKAGVAFEDIGAFGVGNLYLLNNGIADESNATKANARLTVASNGQIGIGTTTPFGQLALSLNVGSVPSGLNAFLVASSTATATTTLFSISNTGLISGLNLNLTGGATTTMLAVTGSTTVSSVLNIGGQLNANLSAVIASTTLTGNSLITHATSTSFAISGISSGNLLMTTTGGAIIAAVAGTDYAPGNVAFPFTTGTFGATLSNSTSTLIGFTQGIYALASSTIGNGTQTGGLTISGGATTTGNALFDLGKIASSTFVVGANGYSNPAFQIFASTTNAETGLALYSNVAGNGITLDALSSAANENLKIQGKGTGNLVLNGGTNVQMQVNGNTRLTVSNTQSTFMYGAHTGAVNPLFLVTAPDESAVNLTAGTEAVYAQFDLSSTHRHGGATTIGLQRQFLINAGTESYQTFSGTITDAATFALTGSPLAGTNAKITNAHSIYLGASALNASTTNSYGLTVNANTGATNNYAAQFLGGNVGIGTTSPYAKLSISNSVGDTAGQALFNISSTTSGTATTTLFSVSNTGLASTTNIIVSSAGGTAGCATFSSTGLISNTGSACGSGGGAAAFTFADNYGVLTAATSSALWAQNGIFASSTSHFVAFDFNNATGTSLAITGSTTISSVLNLGGTLNANGALTVVGNTTLAGATSTSLFADTLTASAASFGGTATSTFTSTGFLGIGTTSPFAKFSLHAQNGDTNTTLFAIGSSTASATSTLFSVSNTGSTPLFPN